MTKIQYVETFIPFAGFYDSLYSSELESQEEQEIENYCERQAEEGIPPELRLTEEDYRNIFDRCRDWRAMCLSMSQSYVDAYNSYINDEFCIDLGLRFKAIDSPREYNFETDRITCDIPAGKVRTLLAQAKRDPDFKETIERRHKSRSGFISFYSADFEEWQGKRHADLDYNEIQTLLETLFGDNPDKDLAVYYPVAEHSYQDFESGIDWEKFDSEVAERREELAAEAREQNPDFVPAYRCKETADLFADKSTGVE